MWNFADHHPVAAFFCLLVSLIGVREIAQEIRVMIGKPVKIEIERVEKSDHAD